MLNEQDYQAARAKFIRVVEQGSPSEADRMVTLFEQLVRERVKSAAAERLNPQFLSALEHMADSAYLPSDPNTTHVYVIDGKHVPASRIISDAERILSTQELYRLKFGMLVKGLQRIGAGHLYEMVMQEPIADAIPSDAREIPDFTLEPLKPKGR